MSVRRIAPEVLFGPASDDDPSAIGTAFAYVDHGALRKLSFVIQGKGWGYQQDLYYQVSRVYFAYTHGRRFAGGEAVPIEERAYFDHGQLIRFVGEDGQVQETMPSHSYSVEPFWADSVGWRAGVVAGREVAGPAPTTSRDPQARAAGRRGVAQSSIDLAALAQRVAVEMTAPPYFTAPNGIVYRVLDTASKDGHLIAANPPAEWATTRVFRSESGERRFYPLAYLELHAETREPRLEWLTRQFTRSEASGPRANRKLVER